MDSTFDEQQGVRRQRRVAGTRQEVFEGDGVGADGAGLFRSEPLRRLLSGSRYAGLSPDVRLPVAETTSPSSADKDDIVRLRMTGACAAASRSACVTS